MFVYASGIYRWLCPLMSAICPHDRLKIKHGVTVDIQGTLIKIDCEADARSRLSISFDATSNIVKSGILLAGGIFRFLTDK